MQAASADRLRTWGLPAFGAAVVLGFAYEAFQYAVLPGLSPFYIGNAYWTTLSWSSSTPLFGYLVLAFGRSAAGSQQGLTAAAETVYFLFAISAYLSLTKLLKRWYAGVVGAILASASPAILAAVGTSAYSVILGFALLFPALFIGSQVLKGFTEMRIVLLTLLSVGTALADPLLGAILALALAAMAPLAAVRRNSRYAVAVIVPTVVALLGLIVIAPGPDIPWGTASSLVLVVAAPVSLLAFYFSLRSDIESVLSLGALSVVSGGASLILGSQYVIPPLLLTCSVFLLKTGRPTTDSVEEGKKFIHIDPMKLVSLVLILVILAADLGATALAFQGTANSDSALISRYGNPELLQTMAWLKSSTPANSVVLSEYPLSQWVQSFGSRASVSNSISNTNLPSFAASYDADTMLNSTYEMRNGYLRVRDWAPVAPQRSPVFAIASGDQYVNVLYVDENHLNLLGPNGTPLSVPYSNYTKVSSGYAQVNGSAALQQKYVVSGVNVERDVFFGSGAQVTTEYVVHSNQTGAVSGAQVQVWVSKDRTVGYTSLIGGTLRLDLDAGNLVLTARGPGQTLTFGPDKVYGQQNLAAHYLSSSQTFSFSITVTGLNINRVSWSRGLELVTASDLFLKYNVAYVIVPTLVKQRQLDLFGLYYPTFTSVYQNDKLTIYQVLVAAP